MAPQYKKLLTAKNNMIWLICQEFFTFFLFHSAATDGEFVSSSADFNSKAPL